MEQNIFKRLRSHASALFTNLHERIDFLAWLNGTEDVSRAVEIERYARTINIIVQRSTACDKIWLSELANMRKRFRAQPLIRAIDKLVPAAEADQEITTAVRTDLVQQLRIIQDSLRQLSTAN